MARESRMAPVLLRLIGQEKVSVVHPGKFRGGNRRHLNILEHMYFIVEIHVRLKK